MKHSLHPTRILHTMLRVRDLDRSIHFYTQLLGMKLLRRKDYEIGSFTLAFLGYGTEEDATVIELTHNWGEHAYERGTAYGHIALEVGDVYATSGALAQAGVTITRAPGPMKADPSDVIAFIEDPDGYKIELIERTSLVSQRLR